VLRCFISLTALRVVSTLLFFVSYSFSTLFSAFLTLFVTVAVLPVNIDREFCVFDRFKRASLFCALLVFTFYCSLKSFVAGMTSGLRWV
jgi:hypothetical protein